MKTLVFSMLRVGKPTSSATRDLDWFVKFRPGLISPVRKLNVSMMHLKFALTNVRPNTSSMPATPLAVCSVTIQVWLVLMNLDVSPNVNRFFDFPPLGYTANGVPDNGRFQQTVRMSSKHLVVTRSIGQTTVSTEQRFRRLRRFNQDRR